MRFCVEALSDVDDSINVQLIESALLINFSDPS